MQNFVSTPIGVHVSKKMEISVILPEYVSLHDLIHGKKYGSSNMDGLSLKAKVNVLIELAKIFN